MSRISDASKNTTGYFIMTFLVVLGIGSIVVPVYFIVLIADKYSMWYWLLIIPFTWVVIFIVSLISDNRLEDQL